MNEIYLQKKEIEQLLELINEFDAPGVSVVLENNNSGIESIINARVFYKKGDYAGTFETQISGIDSW